MTRTSYALNAKYIPFMFLIMFMIVAMLGILLFASVTGDMELILLSFALIAILALIVMTLVLLDKSDVKKQDYEDYSLK